MKNVFTVPLVKVLDNTKKGKYSEYTKHKALSYYLALTSLVKSNSISVDEREEVG